MTDIDDIKLTAYALGEITDAGELAEIEAYLNKNESARAAVEAIRAIAGELTTELANEELPAALPVASSASATTPNPATIKLRRWPARIAIAAAAAVVVGGVAYSVLLPRTSQVDGGHSPVATVLSPSTSPSSTQPNVFKDLQHSYQNPYVESGAIGGEWEKLNDGVKPEFSVAGDISPSLTTDQPARTTQSKEDGQNALYGDGHVQIQRNPFVGVQRDNIDTKAANANHPYAELGSVRSSTDANDSVLLSVDGFKREDASPAARPSQSETVSDLTSRLEVTERERRDLSEQLAESKNEKYRYEDILRSPENWPDNSEVRDAQRRQVALERGVGAPAPQLSAQLDRRLPEVRFDNIGLADVVDFFRDITGSEIVVKWESLEAAGIKRDTPLSARLRDVKFSKALESLLQQAGGGQQLGFNITDGAITIGVGKEFDKSLVQTEPSNTESYARIYDNPFLGVVKNPLSTFSIDVDTASYSNVRRFLEGGQLPPADAVRIEELVNYFPYDYAPPVSPLASSRPSRADRDVASNESDASKPHPFAAHVEIAECPWESTHRLVRVGLKGIEIAADQRPPLNLVFLLDVSGSMSENNKLPLVQQSMKMLLQKLDERDTVTIAVYAGSSGLVLPPTNATKQDVILNAIDNLRAGGSTNGAQGIALAYAQAESAFKKGGANRVILCTDGDFNVGITNEGDLTRLIEDKAKTGVFLSVLGFGMGNLKDSTMEKLADKGNGNYAYIDNEAEAKKVLVDQMSGTLVTIAKDVKIQIEFNPSIAQAYRLIGYENRMLAKEDFNDDKKDAGEIGAGHTVTALYEVVPVGVPMPTTQPGVDPLKYSNVAPAKQPAGSKELLTLKLRYKATDGDKSTLMETPVIDAGESFAKASTDFQFASAVAGFGMLLRESPYKANVTYGAVLEWAGESLGEDKNGYRHAFVDLVKRANAIGGEVPQPGK